MRQKFRPSVCGDDTLGGAAENGESDGLLHVLDGLAESRLTHEQIAGGLRNGTCFFNLQCIAKITSVHGSLSSKK